MRLALAILLAVAAAVAIAISVFADDGKAADLLGNLGAEFVGIALTVAIVDWLLERRRLNEQCRQLAWRMLHDLDLAFWVWQGGRREFHLDELHALIGMARPEDPLPAGTEEMFIALGVRASDAIRLETRLMNHERRLRAGLKPLAGLAQIRETQTGSSPEFIVEALRQAVVELAEIAGQHLHPDAAGASKWLRDPTAEAQAKRLRIALMPLAGTPQPASA